MTEKTILNLDPGTPGDKLVHVVNTDDFSETPQGSSQKVTVNTALSVLRYVDNNTSALVALRDGSIENPFASTTEARAAITDNAVAKQYTLVVIKDDGTSNDPKPYVYQRGSNSQDFTGGARIPNTAGRYEYSNMVCGNVNSDNLSAAAIAVFTNVEFIAGSNIFTTDVTTPAKVTFIGCKFGGKMDFRQVDATFVDCDIAAIEFIDGTLSAKAWKFDRCRFSGAFTTSGSSSGDDFDFIGCHWLASSSFAPTTAMSVTCDSTFPHEANAQVTVVSRIASAGVVAYDNALSGLAAGNVRDAIDELSTRSPNSFTVSTDDAIPISTSSAATTFFSGLATILPITGFTIDSATGSMINASGVTMARVLGSLAIQPVRAGGGGATDVFVYSERSPDGIVWTNNPDSLRTFEIPTDSESFLTISSFVKDWLNGEYIRFKMFTGGAGTITLTAPSTVAEGNAVDGVSVFWSMTHAG